MQERVVGPLRSMPLSRWLSALVASCFVVGCLSLAGCAGASNEGSPDGAGAGGGGVAGADATDGGAAGAGGAVGAAGTIGTAGVVGTTGAAGTAGATDTGGAAGTGGIAGTGGTTGAAGAAGRGGAGDTAGAGGAAGRGGTGGAASGGRGAAAGGGGGALPNITIWIAGDSTVKTYPAGNTSGNNGVSIEGWGQEIGPFFSLKVTINNQANGGRSVATFMWPAARDAAGNDQCVDDLGTPKFQVDASGNKVDSPMWANIKAGIKAGDFLLIQFGHNDETHTCGRYVSIPDYETYLGFMADTARAKGATPIFVTPMGHRTFSGSTVTNTLLPYANAMKDEATKKTIEVEDLNLRSMEYYMSVGNSYLATNIFDGGTTHFIKAGAVKMAELIVGELRKNKGPLAAYLK